MASTPGLLAMRHHESAEEASTLELTYAGYLPRAGESEGAWLEYLAPVVLMRNGKPVFCGKVTAYSYTNNGGVSRTSITATDFIWLLDKQVLGSQVQSLEYPDTPSLSSAAGWALMSWEELAKYIRVAAPGWACDSAGMPLEEAILEIDTSKAGAAVAASLNEDVWLTSWDALLKIQAANPNALYHARPDGKLEVISISEAETVALQSSRVLSAADIAPHNEDVLDGVAVVVYWGEEAPPWGDYDPGWYGPQDPTNPDADADPELPGKWSETSNCYIISDPPDLDLTAANIKIFTASVPYKTQVLTEANHMWQQVRAYYDGRATLQWGGSIVTPSEYLSTSPLGKRLSIGGDRIPAEWRRMKAIVTAVDWDYYTGEATLTLGKSVQDPEVHTIQYDPVILSSFSEEKEETTSSGTGNGSWHIGPGVVKSSRPGGTFIPGGGGGGGGGGGEDWEYTQKSSSGGGEDTEGTATVPVGIGSEQLERLNTLIEQLSQRVTKLENEKCKCAELIANARAAAISAAKAISASGVQTAAVETTETGSLVAKVNWSITGSTSGTASGSISYTNGAPVE